MEIGGGSWDISFNQNGTGVVVNGKLKGMILNENLSVQVHPNDEYAREAENSFGKIEAWYVVESKEGAELL